MNTTLVIALLTTESSYATDTERDAGDVPDSVQFWFSDKGTWRIRTFAIDHDIHIHSVGTPAEGEAFLPEDAIAHFEDSYGDILAKLVTVELDDPANEVETGKALAEYELDGIVQMAPSGFGFYNPDRGTYKTQTDPG